MSRVSLIFAMVTTIALGAGCEAEQCTKMRKCCAAIASEEWVGDSCGAIVENIHDPKSCSAIFSAVEAAAQGRGAELPAECSK